MKPLLSSLMLLPLLVACSSGETVPDPDISSDSGNNLEVETLPTETERKVLHEAFTGSTCGPCAPASENISRVLDAHPDQYTLLKIHVGSDPYISDEGVKRRMYYLPDESSYGIPFVHADGVNGFHPNLMNSETGYQDDDFEAFAAVPSVVEMSVSHSVTDQTVDWEIEILPLADVPADNLRLHVAIMEGTTYNNVGTNGQTEFHNVMKKMVPNQKGSALGALTRGEAVELTGSYTFEGNYAEDPGLANPVDHSSEHTVEEFEDLEVVVWIQNKETWETYQSAWTQND